MKKGTILLSSLFFLNAFLWAEVSVAIRQEAKEIYESHDDDAAEQLVIFYEDMLEQDPNNPELQLRYATAQLSAELETLSLSVEKPEEFTAWTTAVSEGMASSVDVFKETTEKLKEESGRVGEYTRFMHDYMSEHLTRAKKALTDQDYFEEFLSSNHLPESFRERLLDEPLSGKKARLAILEKAEESQSYKKRVFDTVAFLDDDFDHVMLYTPRSNEEIIYNEDEDLLELHYTLFEENRKIQVVDYL